MSTPCTYFNRYYQIFHGAIYVYLLQWCGRPMYQKNILFFYSDHGTLSKKKKKHGETQKYLCLNSNPILINGVPDIIEHVSGFQRTCAYGNVLYLKLNLCTTPFSWQYSTALTSSINHFRALSLSIRTSLLIMSNKLPFSAYSIMM